MGRIDWQGMATAIGQVNQLLEPSYAKKKEMDFQDWQRKATWEMGFNKLIEYQDDWEKKRKEYEDTYNEAFVTDVSLVKDISPKYKTEEAVGLNEVISKGTMAALQEALGEYSERAAGLTNAIGEIDTINRSAALGKNFQIPLAAGAEGVPDWMKGKPVLDNEGTTIGWESWDTQDTPIVDDKGKVIGMTGDNIISPAEANEAIPVIMNMMAKDGNIDPEAFQIGYRSAFDEEKRAQSVVASRRATESYQQGISDDVLKKGRDEVRWENYLNSEEFKEKVTRPSQTLAYTNAVTAQKKDVTKITDEDLMSHILSYEHQAKTSQRFNLDDPMFKEVDANNNLLHETEFQQRKSNLATLNKGKSKYMAEAISRGIDLFSAQDFQEIYHNNYWAVETGEEEYIESTPIGNIPFVPEPFRSSELLFDEDEWKAVQQDPVRSIALSSLLNDIGTTDIDNFTDKVELIKLPDANPEVVKSWNEEQKRIYISLMKEMDGITPSELTNIKSLLGL